MASLRLAACAFAVLTLVGCASKPENITAAYVSPLIYQNLTCEQLGAEATRVSARAAEVTGVQSRAAGRDAVVTGVALVLFWPAAFAVGGDGQSAAELSRLKGEMDAIEQASIAKNCNIRFARPEPEAPPKEKKLGPGGN